MVAFRIGDLRVVTLDDATFAAVLEAAAQEGGAAAYPTLFSLARSEIEVEPLALADELARLAASGPGRSIAHLIATLRDDLMEGLAAAEEG